jgi:hypothetical protein
LRVSKNTEDILLPEEPLAMTEDGKNIITPAKSRRAFMLDAIKYLEVWYAGTARKRWANLHLKDEGLAH